MLRTILLTTVIVNFAVFSIPTSSYALEKQNPCDLSSPEPCDGGGLGGGPGPGDPSLDGSKMPPGGDHPPKNPRAENEMDKPDAPPKRTVVKSIGRVKVPPTSGPSMSICDRARDARGRNSPAAPSLEA